MNETEWLPLFDGTNLSKWGFDGLDNMELEGDTLVISDKAVKAEVGGASWDNYIISMDVLITRNSKKGRYCVQLTGDGTCIYCQLVPGAVLLAYYSEEPKGSPEGFTHIGNKERDIPQDTWFNFQMQARHGVITAIIDDEQVLTADCPRGTSDGFPGFLVNQQEDCEVRIRDIRIKFLEPTKEQLQEYESDASYNWLKCKAAYRTAQPPAGPLP